MTISDKIKRVAKKNLVIIKSILNAFYLTVIAKLANSKTILYQKENYVFEDRDLEFYKNRPFYKFLVEQICSRRGEIKYILDIGCNTGQECFLIAQDYPDVKVVGIDLNKEAIKYAKVRYNLTNLEFYTCDAICSRFIERFSKEEIGLIFCFETIEHLFADQLEKLFKNIHAVSNMNTIILFTTPTGHENSDGFHHMQFFSLNKLEKMLMQYFDLERIGHFRFNPILKRYHNVLFAIVRKRLSKKL